MDDNNKKGYDDFFSSDNGDRTRSEDSSSTNEEQPEGGSREQDSKPAYYYSYGPMSSQPQTSSSADSTYRGAAPDGDTTTDRYRSALNDAQQSQSQGTQLRPFTPSQGGGKNGWQKKEKKGGTSFKAVFASFLAGVILVGGLMYTADVRNWFTPSETVSSQTENNGGSQTAQTGGTGSGLSTAAARPDNIAQLFETASPAVVKIETFTKVQSRGGGSSLLDDPFFRQFFGDNYTSPQQQQEQNGQDSQMQQTGIGTGFFFESTGYILTNQHVIGESDEIRVTVQGYDKPLTAKALGSNYDLDLAVIKVESDKAFPTLPLGSSDDINIGDWVVAIGNPYGFDHTVTVGVLSAKERPIDIQDQQGERNYKHLLQTDASINPGNSGGPLLNVNGEVVGINTAVSSQAQGIGFAIPTSTIQEVLENLKSNTEIPKEPSPFIGAELREMTEEFAKQLGIDETEGSLVQSVYYNSPAYLGDLKQYDLIVGIEGKKLSRDALIEEIKKREVGEKVEFNIIRQGNKVNLEIEIGDLNKFGVTETE